MHDVEVPANSLDGLDGSSAEEREPFGVIWIVTCGGSIKRFAVEILRLVDEPDRNILCTGKSPFQKSTSHEFSGTHWNRKTDVRWFNARMALVDAAKGWHDDGSAMPQCGNP